MTESPELIETIISNPEIRRVAEELLERCWKIDSLQHKKERVRR